MNDVGNIERRLRKLRPYLDRLEDNLLAQGEHPADEALARAQRIRDEIKRNEEQLAELKRAESVNPVGIGDVIKVKGCLLLVGRLNHRTYTGWLVEGGQPAKFAKHHFDGTILQRANTKLLEAAEHRAKIKAFFGDDTWLRLLREGISCDVPDLSKSSVS